ncbi:MAG: hypothetical protein JRJ12_08255 [Deltaproteobacteria bacterium]|nr:hypothetical protein [Deltaproteobacteria bacterium]
MKRLVLFLFILTLCAVFFYKVDRMRHTQPMPVKLLLLPSKQMTRVISFGYRLLASQLIFYNSMFFVGSLDSPPTVPTYQELFHTLDTVTYLDPYNMDGYYFAQGLLSWNRSFIEPLNSLLLRGMSYRKWDWYLPFFYGFNQFYFLKNPKKAAPYLRRAYRLNPENEFLPTLIARLYYQGDETRAAIDYLEEMSRTASSKNLRRWINVRLRALRTVLFLEEAMERYEKRFGRKPARLEELIAARILRAIPPDPYGGKFYLDAKGRVRTTSNFAFSRQGSAKKKRSSASIFK